MQYKFLNYLKKKELEKILDYCDDNSELEMHVKKRLEYIRRINEKECDFSSDRMSEDFEIHSEKVKEIMNNLKVSRFPFLLDTLFGAKVNKMNKIPQEFYECYGGFSLAELEDFLQLDTKTRYYESTYNTLNYIKSYICSCLATNSDFVIEDLFSDYDKKKEVVTENFGDIVDIIKETKSGTKLVFSVRNKGLVSCENDAYDEIHPYKKIVVDAIAFGNELTELENGNYEGVKRLLYLPKGTRNKK